MFLCVKPKWNQEFIPGEAQNFKISLEFWKIKAWKYFVMFSINLKLFKYKYLLQQYIHKVSMKQLPFTGFIILWYV